MSANEDAKVAVRLSVDAARVLRTLDYEAWPRLRDRRRRLVLFAALVAAGLEVGGDGVVRRQDLARAAVNDHRAVRRERGIDVPLRSTLLFDV
eukprot:scaffold30067_cov76-Phaeocystis_antarctica.AAC.1